MFAVNKFPIPMLLKKKQQLKFIPYKSFNECMMQKKNLYHSNTPEKG